MTLQTTNVPIALIEGDNREGLLVFVHALRQTAFADDDHPTAYLHWAALLPQRQMDLKTAKEKNRDAPTIKRIEGVTNLVSRNKERLRLRYEHDRACYREAYVRWVAESKCQFDGVICCPSSRGEAQFYREPVTQVVRQKNPKALDLSDYFHKDEMFKVGSGEATIQQGRDRIKFDYTGRLDSWRNVLLIDDVWAKGTTARIVLSYLADSGLQANATIVAFTPLLVPPQKKKSGQGE
jgi:hypothetical protein